MSSPSVHAYPDGSTAQRKITASPSTSGSSTSRLETLTRTFWDGLQSFEYPTTPSMNHLTILVRRLGTPDGKPDRAAHALSYHETVQFLAKSLLHTGVWERKEVIPVVPEEYDAAEFLESKCGLEMIHEIWKILEVTEGGFRWTTTALRSFAEVWVECGAPSFKGEDLRSARAQVIQWIDEVRIAKPELQCPQGCKEHLLLTKTEYQEYFDCDSKKQLSRVLGIPH